VYTLRGAEVDMLHCWGHCFLSFQLI